MTNRTRRLRSKANPELSAAPIQVFAKAQLDAQLKRVEKEWGRCATQPDEPAIHDFRVSLRRFGEGLWLFRRLFPKPARKQVRQELRGVMRLSARVRDVDIVMASFPLVGVAASRAVGLFLENERSIAEAAFLAALAVGLRTSAASRWRETLKLSPDPAPPTQESVAPDTAQPAGMDEPVPEPAVAELIPDSTGEPGQG